MTEPTDIDALIAEARKLLFSDSAFGYEDTKEGDLIFRLADTLEAAAAELRQERDRAALLEGWGADIINERTQAEADRDRLHKAITEALESLDPSTGAGGAMDDARRILRAALDQGGNDDE